VSESSSEPSPIDRQKRNAAAPTQRGNRLRKELRVSTVFVKEMDIDFLLLIAS
jgi:hypothetical protein